jgi:hypothetical protein
MFLACLYKKMIVRSYNIKVTIIKRFIRARMISMVKKHYLLLDTGPVNRGQDPRAERSMSLIYLIIIRDVKVASPSSMSRKEAEKVTTLYVWEILCNTATPSA